MATRHEWTVKLHPDAENELDELPDHIRRSAIEELDALRDGEFSPNTIPLRGHRGHERLNFYHNAYRMIYRINRKQRSIVITRIRKRGEKTYAGYDAEGF